MKTPEINLSRNCVHCKAEFVLKSKKLIDHRTHCSSSCSARGKLEKRYAFARTNKECPVCKVAFYVTMTNKDKEVCSQKCHVTRRYCNIAAKRAGSHDKLNTLLGNERLMKFLKGKARGIAIKYRIDEEEIMQDFFLRMASGHSVLIEQSAAKTIRFEFTRGMTGERYVNRAGIMNDDVLQSVQSAEPFIGGYRYADTVHDLNTWLNESEVYVIGLALKGYNRREAYDRRGVITALEFDRIWQGNGLSHGGDTEPVEFDAEAEKTKRKDYVPSHWAGAVYRIEQ